jgi:RHS repeat-associated protein
VTRTDRNGQRIDYAYDGAHQLVSETWAGPTPVVFTYAYTDAGQIEEAGGPGTSVRLDYWNTGLLRSVTTSTSPGGPATTVTYGCDAGGDVTPGYDPNGNITHVLDGLGALTEYHYDDLDRLVSVRQRPAPGGGGPSPTVAEKRVDFTYDDAGLIQSLRRYGNLAGTTPAAYTTYTYGCGSCSLRVTGLDHRRGADGSSLETMTFVRDDFGNVTTLTDSLGVHNCVYDGLGRLLAVTHPAGGGQPDESYSYDPAGNRLSSHQSPTLRYSYQAPYNEGGNQLREDSQFSYQYDRNGNLLRRVETATGSYMMFAYDPRGRIVRAEAFGPGGTLLRSAEYTFDALGRRVRAVEDGVVQEFVYDGVNPIVVLDGAGSPARRRLYSRYVDGILADQEGGTVRWLLTDHVGTVRALVDSAGMVLDRYTYDAFGSLLAQSGLGSANDLLFGAREFSRTTGLGYYRGRSYDPAVGRFLQEDVFFPYQYEYALNSPLLYSDPFGEAAIIEYVVNLVRIQPYRVAACIGTLVAGIYLTAAGVLNGVAGNITFFAAGFICQFKAPPKPPAPPPPPPPRIILPGDPRWPKGF